jgi:membrane protease subunit (stomatin/prohibitin family)
MASPSSHWGAIADQSFFNARKNSNVSKHIRNVLDSDLGQAGLVVASLWFALEAAVNSHTWLVVGCTM